jgi:glycosyltransferase involved in cell wall biosynthesis
MAKDFLAMPLAARSPNEELPLVSVGMPLYNNSRTIERAINSLRRQTWKNIEIIISDDGSSDDTYEICKKIGTLDKRIRLFRQNCNLYYQNFRFVLESSSADYFMWAAGDDYWRPKFIEENLSNLLNHTDAVSSVSRCLFIQDGKAIGLANGTYPLLGKPEDNIEAFLRNPIDNTRMYGVFKRDVLLKSFPSSNFHAYDWALSAATLRFGKHYEVESVLMRRDKTPTNNYCHTVNRDHHFFLLRYFPVLRMSIHLILNTRIPMTKNIFKTLLRLNIIKHQKYMEVMSPYLYSKLSFFYSALDKRFVSKL